jgi:hypothetical protein
MAIISSIPKLVSTKILRVLHNELVAKKICTQDPDAPIKKEGDTVYFSGLAKPTINDYTGTITYEDLQDGQVALLIDQKKYYAFKVPDIEAFQSNIDVKGSQTSEAAYELANTADAFIFGLHAGAGLTHTDASVDVASVLSTTSTTLRKLEEKNVRANNMWMVIPPWYAEKLRLAGVKFQINNGMNGEGGMKWADYNGATLYVSNNIVTTGNEGSLASKILAGSYNSIIFAQQLLKNRFIPELEDSFAGGASGLMVYGGRVLKPGELICLTATQTAETTI